MYAAGVSENSDTPGRVFRALCTNPSSDGDQYMLLMAVLKVSEISRNPRLLRPPCTPPTTQITFSRRCKISDKGVEALHKI
jgi:hypothetical protein